MINSFLNQLRDLWYFLTTFFPVQLFLLHLRRSLLLVIFWLMLFALTGGWMAESYGFRYLFLTPEYLDRVSFFSYFVIGITSGLFVMAFHISSYIYYSYRYPFLATLSRPLWKFSINNSIIPLAYYSFYVYQIADLLLEEHYPYREIITNIAGLLLGSMVTISFSFTYFISTIHTLEIPDEKGKEHNPLKPLKGIMKTNKEWLYRPGSVVNYYLKNFYTMKLARGTGHYSRQRLQETIQQHHFSASVYFVILILLVIGLSLVENFKIFIIPAGATIFLIFALYLMVTGAFYTRMKTWTVTIGVSILLILNYFSGFEQFRSLNYAYGMNYSAPPAKYNYQVLDSLTTDSLVEYDKAQTLLKLENWKQRCKAPGKPKLIILNVSGGGQRSALWALQVLQRLDSATDGQVYNQMHLITGSSGGMLGASFYREMKYRYRYDLIDIHPGSDTLAELMGKDLLNPVCFTLAVNDLFFRLPKVEYGNRSYPIDRGYAFDQRLNEITLGVLNRKFKEYRSLEMNAEMPTLILGPSIVGDGRKLLMNPMGISYLTFSRPYEGAGRLKEHDAIEFSRFFKDQGADNLSYLTALRLSASFPYITPLVNMPSDPTIELIDAGVRDNEGFELALRYIFKFREWLKENTSGVMIIQVKANRPDEIPIDDRNETKLDQLIMPLGGVLQSFHNLQIYNKALLMEMSKEELRLPVSIYRFSLLGTGDKVSLSWHLTENEKRSISKTFHSELNQAALAAVIEDLKKSR